MLGDGRQVQPLGEYAYEAIRSGILAQRWRPGDPLSEQQLAAELGVSRTPIRQALQQLEREGFVQVLPSRGTFVAELSPDDLRDVYQLREILEGQAARLAAEAHAREGMGHLVAQLQTILDEAWTQIRQHSDGLQAKPPASAQKELHRLGIRFHGVLAQMAGNRRLHEVLLGLEVTATRARLLHGSFRDPREAWTDHAEVLDAVRAGDADGAERVMRRHIYKAYEFLLQRIQPHQGRE